KNKKRLEKELNVKITNRGKEVMIEGAGMDEYLAEKVIDAIDFGFPFSDVLALKDEDFSFGIMNIKDYTKRKDFEVIRARIIGKGGKTLKTLSQLTNCNFELKNNSIGIIGSAENIKNAEQAVISIVKGAKQSNVYSYLEKHHPLPILDLGLKSKFKQFSEDNL
ncbi:MAG TPA: KH domain-containing protein, partial [Candidatus Nanoarchaeia archaeon]|nr:KH domain-containing protein [Candidatus Nanoarchaeia archaeon]